MHIVFFCGALCSAASLSGYTDLAKSKGFATAVVVPNTNPLTANHARDLERMREEVEASRAAFERQNGVAPSLSFFAFSGGAKFAARIAQDTRVEGLFLLDPVDGPPPVSRPSPRFPVYLDEASPAWRVLGSDSGDPRAPAALRIVATELGEQPGFTGTPCVTPAYGPSLFAERLGALPGESVELPGAGHLDALFRGAGPLGAVCPRGSAPEAARAQSVAAFEGFLNEVNGTER